MGLKTKIILGISLALNLLFVGALLGRFGAHFRYRPHDQWGRQPPTLKSPALKNELEQFQQARQANRAQIREQREELIKVFTAENFDVEAFQKVAQKTMQLRHQNEESFFKTLGNVGQKLSQEERQALVPWLLKRDFKKKFKGGPKG